MRRQHSKDLSIDLTILIRLQGEICLVYLDNIIIIAKAFHEFIMNIETTFFGVKAEGLENNDSQVFAVF